MIREWMAYALVVGALVAATGLCLEALCRATGRASRWACRGWRSRPLRT